MSIGGNVTPKQVVTGTLAQGQGVNGSMRKIPVGDKTLTKEGYYADAAAVGEALANVVPATRKINGKALSSDITLSASDVGAITRDGAFTCGAYNGDYDEAPLGTWWTMPYRGACAHHPEGATYGFITTAKCNTEISQTYTQYASGKTWFRSRVRDNNGVDTWYGWFRTDSLNSAPASHTHTAADVGARPDTWMPTAAQVGARSNTWMPSAADVGARSNTWMPTAEQVGARSNTWMPSASDVGAVPTSRKVNNKALSSDIALSADDVGARPATWMPTAADVGAPTMELLWKNSATTSSFAAQTVSLDLSGYDYVVIVGFYYSGNIRRLSPVISQIPTSVGALLCGYNLSNGAMVGRVVSSVTAEGITFGSGYRSDNFAAAVANDGACIPYQIFGIKGVSG